MRGKAAGCANKTIVGLPSDEFMPFNIDLHCMFPARRCISSFQQCPLDVQALRGQEKAVCSLVRLRALVPQEDGPVPNHSPVLKVAGTPGLAATGCCVCGETSAPPATAIVRLW